MGEQRFPPLTLNHLAVSGKKTPNVLLEEISTPTYRQSIDFRAKLKSKSRQALLATPLGYVALMC